MDQTTDDLIIKAKVRISSWFLSNEMRYNVDGYSLCTCGVNER